ncbi:hypothetical protein [Nocardia harenae]|uniref:hypothetical protein n=1 Tax=Nocardia harenae TaxID=358707 RepID=UPI000835FB5C|nr:hypothetical protein [Nocardia harenae]
MGDRLEVYVDRLRFAATTTDRVRDRINEVVTTLTATIEGRGAPWGDDAVGNQFLNGSDGNGYAAARTALIDGSGNMATSFGNFSDAQNKAANELVAMDHDHGFA